MSTKKDTTIMFSSKTRLYTNFNMGEHKEDYVVSACKESIKNAVSTVGKDLNSETFVEAILSGADTFNLGFNINTRSSYTVKPRMLGEEYTRLLLKLFCSPFTYFKEVRLVEDSDGSLAADFMVIFSVPLSLADSVILDESSVEITFNRLKALYNIGMAAKHIMFRRIQKALSASPGLLVNDICDVYDVEHSLDDDKKKIIKISRPIKAEEGTAKEIWSSSLKAFLA